MTDAIQIENTLGTPIVALPAELAERAQVLVDCCQATGAVQDDDSFRAADALAGEAKAFLREIEARRAEVKRPVLDLGRAIDGVFKDAASPLEQAVQGLGRRLIDYSREQQRKAEEARRKAEAEERARLEAERKEQERIRALAELEAAAAGEEAPAPAPVRVEPPKPVSVPKVEVVRSASLQTRKLKRVRVADATLVPIQIGGRVLRPVDEKAVLDLLKAGIEVPGCEMVEEEVLASTSRRS